MKVDDGYWVGGMPVDGGLGYEGGAPGLTIVKAVSCDEPGYTEGGGDTGIGGWDD